MGSEMCIRDRAQVATTRSQAGVSKLTRVFPHLKGTPLHLQVAKWQWFLECSPGAFPTRKVIDQLWLQKRLAFHFIVALGAVGLAQGATTRSQAGVSSGVHQGLSPPEKWQWFLECCPDQKERLIFHFIVAWALWAWHKGPLPEARQGSPSGVHQGLSPPERYLATSASPSGSGF